MCSEIIIHLPRESSSRRIKMKTFYLPDPDMGIVDCIQNSENFALALGRSLDSVEMQMTDFPAIHDRNSPIPLPENENEALFRIFSSEFILNALQIQNKGALIQRLFASYRWELNNKKYDNAEIIFLAK